jgi:hypothetical protein
MEVATVDPPSDSSTGQLDDGSTSEVDGSTEPATTGVPGEPQLAISDGPSYDYGLVAIGGRASHTFAVANVGSGTATGLAGQPLDPPFGYAGEFPGAEGTCGTELAAGDSCLVEVAFLPTDLGVFDGVLTVAYDGGADAARDVVGGGSGESGNLLMNPGGEDMGSPPPGWTPGVGVWTAGPVPETQPHSGGSVIEAETGPSDTDITLRQDVSVAAWSTTVDAGLLRVSFNGQARSYLEGDDDHRIRLYYRDAGGSTLQMWSTNYVSVADWTEYADVRTAPVGTREVRVELGCRKWSGTYCSAYFDTMDLHVAYP